MEIFKTNFRRKNYGLDGGKYPPDFQRSSKECLTVHSLTHFAKSENISFFQGGWNLFGQVKHFSSTPFNCR